MKVNPKKYVVIKRSDLVELREKFTMNPNYIEAFNILEDQNIEDAVVIRRRDTFAYSAFNSYAGSVITALEVMEIASVVEASQMEYLYSLADYFSDQANQARQTPSKVPD